MLTSGRRGRAGTWGQSQFIPEHSPDIWKGDPSPHGRDKFVQFRLCVPCLLSLVCKHWVWIRKESTGFSNSPFFLVQQRMFRPQSTQTSFTQGGYFGHIRWSYPECKATGVLGLPPDDDRDPSGEQQQQHSHCCEHGVSREHMSGPLGQDQAQDAQQENFKGQGGGQQAGPKRQRCQDLGSHPSLKPPTSGRAIISPRLLNWQNTHSHSIQSISEYE